MIIDGWFGVSRIGEVYPRKPSQSWSQYGENRECSIIWNTKKGKLEVMSGNVRK